MIGRGTTWMSLRIAAIGAVLVGAAIYVALILPSSGLGLLKACLAILLAQPFAVLAILFPAFRLVGLAGPPADVRGAFKAVSLSVSLFQFLPGRLSEGAKPLGMKLWSDVPVARGLAAVAVERLLDLFCLAALAIVAMVASPVAERVPVWIVATFGGIGVLGIATILIAVRSRSALLRYSRILPAWVHKALSQTLDVGSNLATTRGLLAAVSWSLLAWLSAWLVFVVVFWTLEVTWSSPPSILFVFVASTFGYVVAVAPGGVGTYEAAFAMAYAVLGHPISEGVAIAIVLRVANIAPAVVATAWIAYASRTDLSGLMASLRAMRRRSDG